MEKKDHERLKATRENVKNGTATFAERNFVAMHDKRQRKKNRLAQATAATTHAQVRSAKRFGR